LSGDLKVRDMMSRRRAEGVTTTWARFGTYSRGRVHVRAESRGGSRRASEGKSMSVQHLSAGIGGETVSTKAPR